MPRRGSAITVVRRSVNASGTGRAPSASAGFRPMFTSRSRRRSAPARRCATRPAGWYSPGVHGSQASSVPAERDSADRVRHARDEARFVEIVVCRRQRGEDRVVQPLLRRELGGEAREEIRGLLRTVHPFEVHYDKPAASTQHAGVAYPVAPQERFDELKRTIHQERECSITESSGDAGRCGYRKFSARRSSPPSPSGCRTAAAPQRTRTEARDSRSALETATLSIVRLRAMWATPLPART